MKTKWCSDLYSSVSYWSQLSTKPICWQQTWRQLCGLCSNSQKHGCCPGFLSLIPGASGLGKMRCKEPPHLEMIQHNTCAEHIILQSQKVWQARVNHDPRPPPVDVHTVMLHDSLPIIPLLSPVFSQLVYLRKYKRQSWTLSMGSKLEVRPGLFSPTKPLAWTLE